MSDRLADLGEAAVALVTFTRQRNLRGYRSRLALAYPVLADESRACYRAYGLGRGPWWRIWGASTLLAYGRLLRSGQRRLRRPEEDTLQLGGDFVIGRDGRLVFVYRSTGPSDRPAVDALVEAVRRA